MKIKVNNLVSSLGILLDLTQKASQLNILEDFSMVNYDFRKFSHHSIKSTYIAMEICNELNFDYECKKKVYIACMLHDIGINSSNNYYLDSKKFIHDHCEKGSKILERFPRFNNLSNIIYYHHENYDGSGAFKVSKDLIPIESQIIRLADVVETRYYESSSPALKDNIIKWVKDNNEKLFSPLLCNAFLNLSKKDVFWLNLDNITFHDFIFKKYTPNFNLDLSLKEFLDISYIFADIVDMSSSFTGEHSKNIGDLSYMISNHINYSEEKCIKMKIAGLLHDIGKLAIPKSILNKNDSLTREEFHLMKSHVYYTNLVLERIEDIPDICEWASNHHEKLNGNGYPRMLNENNLSEECRILAVCDIYQALHEDRPYRKGLDNDKIFKILDDSCNHGFLCKDAVSHLKNAL